MNRLKRIWEGLKTAAGWTLELARHPVSALTRTRGHRVAYVEELPEKIKPRVLYVLSEQGLHLQASMACPEGCGTVINLNLLPDDHPMWRLAVDSSGAPTLHPSVWRREGCGAHFFLRGGRIVWC